MRGGALPPALLCGALGLALGFAPRRALPAAFMTLAGAAVAASLVHPPSAWADGVFAGCWVSVVVTAAAVHLPKGVGRRTAAALALNAGIWAGLVVAAAGKPLDLAKALPAALIALPAAWLVAKRWGIALKVASSWLIAVALLAAFLPVTTPTPGYKPDHMD